MSTTYSTKDQAERMGRIEADKLTRRGYPTTFIRAEQIMIEGALHLDGTTKDDQTYYKSDDIRWIAILSAEEAPMSALNNKLSQAQREVLNLISSRNCATLTLTRREMLSARALIKQGFVKQVGEFLIAQRAQEAQ
jgi:hypothetical protein